MMTVWKPAHVAPLKPGWYTASTSMRDEGMVRYWCGVSWSAPCYGDDPQEAKERACSTPARLEAGLKLWWLDVQGDTAPELLGRAQQHLADRAAAYDQPEGERSMAATVGLFNAACGRNLTESEGWLFMALLKVVRDRTTSGHADSQEDLIAYAALYAEARRKEAA